MGSKKSKTKRSDSSTQTQQTENNSLETQTPRLPKTINLPSSNKVEPVARAYSEDSLQLKGTIDAVFFNGVNVKDQLDALEGTYYCNPPNGPEY